MNKLNESSSWVVYRLTLRGKTTRMSAVCGQEEWEAMELAQPGHHTLVRSGIRNEGEAERLARSSSTEGQPESIYIKLPSRT
jgi:hypothetical protein